MADRWRGFVRRYGWRAYALPILTVITIAVLVQGTTSPATPHRRVQAAAPALAGGSHAVVVDGGTDGVADFRPGSTPAPVVVRHTVESLSCNGNEYDRLVLVSISKQHVWMCDGQRQVYSSAVTTGATTDDDQTPVGSWRVQGKQRDRYLVGPGYKDYVRYWVPFNGDFGFHDASWQTMPFGSKDYTTQGSHGCVHLPIATMKWFYAWAQVSNTVVTVAA